MPPIAPEAEATLTDTPDMESEEPKYELPPDPRMPKLTPQGDTNNGLKNSSAQTTGVGATTTVISSLAIVLGVFFAFIWIMRRTTPAAQRQLPKEVIEVLGRAPLNGKQHLQLLRLGRKLVLIVVTPDGADTLAEITDLDEANRLAALCMQSQENSSTTAFRGILEQFATQKAEPGYFGTSEDVEQAGASLRKLGDRRA